ncbi:hypothetical protein A1O3_01757 [Capronia epimyces CBS 606.96]|uniref:RED-like N-terminal domain-containing protein n=1 Tax=Capronia epimyces CBS 606.96 TaxID=1182542 RepID=W9YU30_9EURO|nr:uncharacterized protein A1O3_01757 [Capronia epimyces CBS 606.96]EXJ93200.1 hypothetical protein A1O3_01757 [Capronia epimyces CBS 606.96]
MDNSQFRNLLQAERSAKTPGSGASDPSFKKPALGSRARASIPMTPRSVAGYSGSRDFARQVAEHRREQDGQPPTKKFRSSAAPKGTKLATGYNDRTLARRAGEDDAEPQDDKGKRLKALEEMYKLQQIDEATFESLKSQIGIGGSISSTHLIKGLDWKLLDKVRRGEDVNNESSQPQEIATETEKVDVEDELDQVLDKEVQAKSPATKKKESKSTADEVVDAQPMSRDEILRQLKESRTGKRETAPVAPKLGERFKKVTSEKSSNKKKFVEVVNGRRREVLVITNKDGTTKRKSRWIDDEDSVKQAQPLGMEVPAEFLAKQQALLAQQAEDEDDDIFQGAGDYDPLAGIKSESDDSGAEEQGAEKSDARKKEVAAGSDKPRNYFSTSTQADEVEDRSNPITKDPTLLAALKRAAALKRSEEQGGVDVPGSDPDREAKQQQLLARLKERDRADAMDLDLGFGESRFGDDDDEEGPIWEEGEGGGKKSGRKRGPKKHKGDKDNVKDVMAVLDERRKDKP